MKYKKRELLQTVALLEEANQLVRNATPQRLAAMEGTLEECQQAAIHLGTYLDTQGEKAEPIVRLLEDYCEAIYQLSKSLTNAELCRKLSKKIQKQLSSVKNSIRYELPRDKKEVVFLPYKASMWDSLESIWEAAKEDEDCEVYVVPIPYFDKNPDGTLACAHYEGDEYPEYVPVTDWEKYDLAQRRPDMIYIHNPYDECNYVTTVHPDFYAEKLKEYTEMLVYVPYFISINDHVEEHFCTTPGVLYADRVVVESEHVKKEYIQAIRKFEKENNCKGKFGNLEEKILAVGSPKLDRLGSFKKENLALPEEWERLIRKEDGTRKKVVLYNTTVAAMLKYSDKIMEKIRNSLQVFRESPEIVLLWRPHPLFLSTLYSMRPHLYEEYCRIVQEYREEAWGIYDDTADIDRAIVVSDAYYGDMSSVVELYKATGKPMMLQNMDILYGEESEVHTG